MELVEGETLAARLRRGKLPMRETLRFGAQIAEALAVAHAHGIVHRDLKPANIMLTKSGVKVLDFGLAKSAVDPGLTATGKVMGTPAYMSPERLEGKEADARADIYALGLILAEMATGRRSRQGPEGLPPALDRVVRRCLEADPDDRWQSARDLRWELESMAGALAASPSGSRLEVAARPRSRNALLAAALAFAVLLAVVLAVLRWRQQPPSPPLARMNVLLPDKSRVLSLAVSPDGRAIAVVLVKDGKQQIWVRALDALEMTPLDGTDGAADPFWSPDSRIIGFFADARLKKIEAFGGPVQTLCDALGALGGTWNPSGDILIGSLAEVQRVSDAGGAVSSRPGHAAFGREIWPSFLPDGRHYVAAREGAQAGVWLDSMDSVQARQILPDETNAAIAAPPPGGRAGAVLFTRSGTLMELPFDMKRLRAVGDPVPLAQGIAPAMEDRWLAATSGQGTLVYVSGQSNSWRYVWRDRQGKELGAIPDAGSVVMISRDGKRLVTDRAGNIWVIAFATGSAIQLTFNRGILNPIWSPDGRYVAYLSNNAHGLVRKLANGAGPEELLLRTTTLTVPKNWSPDGRYIAYDQVTSLNNGAHLFALPVEGDRKPLVLANSPGNQDQGQFSPDGHWVAYTSNETGVSEIYVIPFPPNPGGGKWMVSRGGGVQARWRRDGRELFYISPDWKMMAVDVTTSPTFQAGTPHPQFDTDMVDTGIRTGPISWDIAPDGKRFLIVSPDSTGVSSLNVVLNWRPAPQK